MVALDVTPPTKWQWSHEDSKEKCSFMDKFHWFYPAVFLLCVSLSIQHDLMGIFCIPCHWCAALLQHCKEPHHWDIDSLRLEQKRHWLIEAWTKETLTHWGLNKRDIDSLRLEQKRHWLIEAWTKETLTHRGLNKRDIDSLRLEQKRHWLIEAWRKWLPVCRWHFLERKLLYFEVNFI